MPSVLYSSGDRRTSIPVYLQCGACGFTFNVDDRVVAIRGKPNSVVVETRDVGGFPSTRYCDRGESLSLQRSWIAWPRDSSGSEYATVHEDCLKLYTRNCQADDKIRRLWIAACWRRPWFEAEPLNLPPNVDVVTAMDRAADICDLPGLHSLPAEVSEMIWDQSPPNSIWRFSSVLDLARTLSEAEQTEQMAVPLNDVFAWCRGSPPTIKQNVADPIIRLTIDSQGLRAIERLSEMPATRNFRSDNLAYIVWPIQELSGATVLFELGLARLGGSMKTIPNYTWDTPTPPVLRQCLPYTRNLPLISRFSTIDTSKCTGLTFFVSPYRVDAIHAHTPEMPSALPTWERLMYHDQREVIWVYLPLSQKDRITAFGLRMKMFAGRGMTSIPCFLVRMSKSGDVSLGPWHEDSVEDFVFTTEGQPTLIHNVSELDPMSIFGVHPAISNDTSITPRLPSERILHYNTCFSSASLQDVSSVDVFYDRKTGRCRGALIEYEEGVSRAIGQCRVGVDEVRTTPKPKWFCYREHHQEDTPSVPRSVEAQCTAESSHSHEDVGWKCFEMGGVLECWAFGENTVLKVSNA